MSEPAPFGTPETACDHLAQMAGALAAHATVLQNYADLRFFPGVEFASRVTLAYLRAVTAAADEVERSRAVVMLRERAGDIGSGQGV